MAKHFFVVILFLALNSITSASVIPPAQSPFDVNAKEEYVVDLGSFEQEGFLSSDESYVRFTNIPYGESPTGYNSRFGYPSFYFSDSFERKNGSVERICPQGLPGWVKNQTEFLKCFVDKENCKLSDKFNKKIEPQDYAPYVPLNETIEGAIVDEDCLFLDVYVPRTVWEKKDNSKVAVMIWVHGGGFVFGWKSQQGNPDGLFQAAAKDGGEEIIMVSINYRLGAFGWLGGNNYMSQGGIPNAGLHDQKLAFEWVSEFIELFGGDKDRVTVMGESAGASSILHHITSYGGDEDFKPPFQRAIMMSPAFFPEPDPSSADQNFLTFMFTSEAFSLSLLKSKDTKILKSSNDRLNYYAPYGLFGFGPVVEGFGGGFVPKLPGQLLKEGKYHKGISVLMGHSFADGLLFTPPWIRSGLALTKHIKELYPTTKQGALLTIAEKYPIATIDPRQAIIYVSDALDDVSISCNNVYLQSPLIRKDSTPVYRYLFGPPPSPIHGLIPYYVFYNEKNKQEGSSILPPPDPELAKYTQTSFLNYIRSGNPNPKDADTPWPKYEVPKDDKLNRRVMRLGDYLAGSTDHKDAFDTMFDIGVAGRCEFWQDAPYYNAPDDDELVKQQIVINEDL